MAPSVLVIAAFFLFQAANGSIEGTVVSSVTSSPVAGARITATKVPNLPSGIAITGGEIGEVDAGIAKAISGVPSSGGVVTRTPAPEFYWAAPVQLSVTTVTDVNGRFVLENLEPGTYLLRAEADGYARQEPGSRTGGPIGTSTQVQVSAGQAVRGTTLHLTPGGTVSGRVTDSNGDPLVNMEVAVLRPGYDAEGRKTLRQTGTAQTNDRGEYRLFWITPGRYYLSVAGSPRPIPGVPFASETSRKYPRTFYPSTTDISGAAPVDVSAGGDLGGVDVGVTEEPRFRVHGRVQDSATGQPPRTVSIGIVPRSSVLDIGMSPGSAYNPADGTFELRDVPSGSYLIRGQVPFAGRLAPGQPTPFPSTAASPVDVIAGDVDGVVLTLQPPVTVFGRVWIEGESSRSGIDTPGFALRPTTMGYPGAPPPRGPKWIGEDSFAIDNVLPGEYRIAVGYLAGPESNLYVKEARMGSVDLLTRPVSISGPTSDQIAIVFAKNGGQVAGTIRSGSQQPLSRARVVLVPDQRARHDLYRTVMGDANGRFTIRGVAPGSYRLFAWDQVEPNSWLDPGFIQNFERQGTAARVTASSNLIVDVTVIRSSP